jgi:hypothetical protein
MLNDVISVVGRKLMQKGADRFNLHLFCVHDVASIAA